MHTLSGHSAPVRALAFTQDSNTLITGSDDKRMNLYDVQHGTSTAVLSGHNSWITGIAVSADTMHFATSCADRAVRIWDITTRQCVHTFTDHTDMVGLHSYSYCYCC